MALMTSPVWRVAAAVMVVVFLAVVSSCASSPFAGTASKTANAPVGSAVRLPPAGGVPDYQLGEAYEPADDIDIVTRDRTARPVPGRYSICYINGFQTQPEQRPRWDPDLLLVADGASIVDPDWPDEVLLDTSTAEKRRRIAEVVGPWITGCARAGFDAVELDNLDSFTRSRGLLSFSDNSALAARYVELAHQAGLAAGQKNVAERSQLLHDDIGFDFAIAEECAAFDECDAYTTVYGSAVIAIEYTDSMQRTWNEICADPDTPESVVLRDRELTGPDNPDHVARHC